MDFTLTEEQQALQAAARAFARGEMTAVAEETEREAAPLSRTWVKRYAEMGFLGVNISPVHGGLGLGNVEAFLVLEEFAKVSSAVAFPIFESVAGPVRALEHFADGALTRRVIPAVCRAEAIVAVKCTRCHTSGRIEATNQDRRWWARTVRRMQREAGWAWLCDGEAASVVAFLAARDGHPALPQGPLN